MSTKAVVFCNATPPVIDHCRSLIFWANAVFPVVGIGKASSGPSKVRYFQFTQCLYHVVSYAVGIRNGLVSFSYIKTSINTVTKVLGKMPVNIFINDSMSGIGTDNYTGLRC